MKCSDCCDELPWIVLLVVFQLIPFFPEIVISQETSLFGFEEDQLGVPLLSPKAPAGS